MPIYQYVYSTRLGFNKLKRSKNYKFHSHITIHSLEVINLIICYQNWHTHPILRSLLTHKRKFNDCAYMSIHTQQRCGTKYAKNLKSSLFNHILLYSLWKCFFYYMSPNLTCTFNTTSLIEA